MSQKADGHYTMAADTGFIGLPEILQTTFLTQQGIPFVAIGAEPGSVHEGVLPSEPGQDQGAVTQVPSGQS